MGEFEPILKRADCGDGYSLAQVWRTTGTGAAQSKQMVAVQVDLNKGDGTPDPRVILPDGTSVKVDADFVSKYEAMASRNFVTGDEKEKACRELNPEGQKTLGQKVIPPLLMAGSLLLARGSAYLLEDMALYPENRIQGFSNNTMRLVMLGGDVGIDFFGHAIYVSEHKRLSPTGRYVFDGIYGVSVLAAALHVAAFNGGDASLQHVIQGINTVSSANMTTQFGDGYGAWYQLGLGALEFGLAFAVPTQPTVSSSQAYVDPSNAGDHYHVAGNPYQGIRFPNLKVNLLRDGGSLFLWGLVQGIAHLAGGNEATTKKLAAVNVDILPSPDGRSAGGTALTFDVGRLMGWQSAGSMGATEF